MVSSSCCTSNQIPLSSYRLVSQPNSHICISSAPCRWNLPALTSPTYSKTEIVKITLLRLTIAGRMFDRFKNILFLSYHRLSRLSPKSARPLQPPDITGNHLPILRPLFSILDTTILTDFRLHACTVTIIYYQF